MKMLTIGHRGACGYAPENTIPSFRKALELGVDMIEMDVYRCKSGEIVVIHDERLERTTNGAGRVEEKTRSELQRLDAGNGATIPLLVEALDCIGRRAQVNIELKGGGTAEPVAAIIADYVSARGWAGDDFLVSSFDHGLLRQFARCAGGVRIGLLFSDISAGGIEEAAEMRAFSVNLDRASVTPALVKDIHGRGMKVLVYTVNEREDAARFRQMGVDGVFSNYPDRL